jgi:hypothetical protein
MMLKETINNRSRNGDKRSIAEERELGRQDGTEAL